MQKNRWVVRYVSLQKMHLIPLIFVLGLTACASLVDTSRPADERYWLEPLMGSPAGVTDQRSLRLEVTAVPGLDTDRVLELGPDAKLAQLGQARWADNLPEVLESVLTRSLTAAGFRITQASSSNRGKCLLHLEVQEFFVRPSTVQVRFNGLLSCGETEAMVVAVSATAARATALTGVIAGFQQALDAATRDLLERLTAVEPTP